MKMGSYLSVLASNGASVEANVNGAITPVNFDIGPTGTDNWLVHRVIVSVGDNQLTAESYGNVGTLANGVRLIGLQDTTEVLDFLDGQPIQSNVDWDARCHDSIPSTYGAGNNYITWRWTFAKAGEPIELRGTHSEKIRVVIQDDLTGLATHRFCFQGYRRSGYPLQ